MNTVLIAKLAAELTTDEIRGVIAVMQSELDARSKVSPVNGSETPPKTSPNRGCPTHEVSEPSVLPVS